MIRENKWLKASRRWATALAAIGTLVSLSVVPAYAASVGTWTDISVNDTVLAPNQFAGSNSLAVDSAGDIFYTGYYTNSVFEGIPGPSGYTWTVIANGTSTRASELAVTGAGTVYVWDSGTSELMQGVLTGGTYTWTNITGAIPFSAVQGLAVGPGGALFAASANGSVSQETAIGSGDTWSTPISTPVANSGGLAVNRHGDLFITDSVNNQIYEGTLTGTTYHFSSITGNGQFSRPLGVAVSGTGTVYVANASSTALSIGNPNGTGYDWSSVADPHSSGTSPATAVVLLGGSPLVLDWNGPIAEYTLRFEPPSLVSQSVTVDGHTAQVIGNLGYNSDTAIQQGTFVGYVEERAAIEAGATFSGEGTNSAYLSTILDGSGVGLQQHVSAVQQGQFAALYQKLGVIPTWTDNTVNIPQGVAALVKAGAPTLAIENYLVQLDGFSWVAAQAQAAAGFPMQSST